MEAENVIDRIARQYGYDNLSAEQLRMSTVEKRDDPLKAFSVICRARTARPQRRNVGEKSYSNLRARPEKLIKRTSARGRRRKRQPEHQR
jgi:hypothetical protein